MEQKIIGMVLVALALFILLRVYVFKSRARSVPRPKKDRPSDFDYVERMKIACQARGLVVEVIDGVKFEVSSGQVKLQLLFLYDKKLGRARECDIEIYRAPAQIMLRSFTVRNYEGCLYSDVEDQIIEYLDRKLTAAA